MMIGVSVTKRISSVSQPRGGYINPKNMERIKLESECELYEEESIHPSLVGMTVDYLTRYMYSKNASKAFEISLLGARIIRMDAKAKRLVEEIKGIDDNSIIAACKLVGFDVSYRTNILGYKPIEEINPDKKTIENIKEMVRRSMKFFSNYGPIKVEGFTFEGGYTRTVVTGDGDFLTEDTLWDYKVSKSDPTNKNTLQLLMYYIMGKQSKYNYFDNLKYLAIFNPRLNCIYRYEINKISQETIKDIENNVICYG